MVSAIHAELRAQAERLEALADDTEALLARVRDSQAYCGQACACGAPAAMSIRPHGYGAPVFVCGEIACQRKAWE
jgi:hypothetical protein